MSQSLLNIPKIALGTYGMPREDVITLIKEAILSGYRHFDCAYLYLNEDLVGQAIKNCIDEKLVTREELFITSKLPMNGMRPEKVQYFLKKSLQRLKLDYLDLYLIHAPFATKHKTDDDFYPINPSTGQLDADIDCDVNQTWFELVKAVNNGQIKWIGLSNYNESQLRNLINVTGIKPSVLQNETHLYFQQTAIRKFCSNNNIVYEGFTPLGSPVTAQQFGKKILINDDTVQEIGKKHAATAGQICLSWCKQNEIIPIVGALNRNYVRENIVDIELSEEDLNILNKLDCGERIFYFDHIPGTRDHPNYPFN